MIKFIKSAVTASVLILMTPTFAAATLASNQQGMTNQQIKSAQVQGSHPQNLLNNQTAQNTAQQPQNASSQASSSSSSQQQNQNKSNDNDSQTYAQQFQNTNTTLSGKSVRSTTYFTKIDYWDVKKQRLI